MRRLGTIVGVLAMTAVAGCGGGGGTDNATSSTTAPTTVPVPATTATTLVPPTNLTLRITDVHLTNSEESDNAVRVILPAGVTTASVTLTGLPSPNRVISVCQARELGSRLTSAVCRMPASGEAVTVALGAAAAGVEIVQAGVSGSGPGGNATTLDDVTIRYAASTRDVNVRLPQIATGDSAGRPAFSLTPPGATGTYDATLTWTVIQVFGGSPSDGQLELLQGTSVVNRADSAGLQVKLNGQVPTPGADVSVRVQNIGASAMVNPTLSLQLP